ncbi:MAG TPA: Gfo/Idh/MocA family oxidoreductase [Candidatus Parabacteroides intestinigallinarum]|uniref:Gfo/Idh/MocA family oxidoreductase n=1 Tax=Candidatus Parabacteroides intestinigallinarum TaxID=2838722 RepID=A0A9D1XTE3_9BACT|nr:Gfo/Idh/MocA family oxidoreductase [Candidatus Parabacteroides intestinigallinarum]
MRVLIVGLGSIAKKHINALLQCHPEVEIYALRSSHQAKPYEQVQDWYTWEEALNFRYDFVIISSPTSLHKQVIERLKESGMPLFIEKPLFDSLQGKELIEELKVRKIPTYVACNLRFLEVIRSLQKLLKHVTVNEVNVYCGSYLPDWRPGTDYRQCYSAIPELGGGVHIDLIHEIDYVYWLFGQPKRVHKVFTNKSSLDIRACDYANYLLEYPAFNVNIILNYYRRDGKRMCEIVTSEDTYTANLLDNTLSRAKGEILEQYPQRIIDTYTVQMRFFLSMLETGNFNFNTVEDAYNVLKICLE